MNSIVKRLTTLAAALALVGTFSQRLAASETDAIALLEAVCQRAGLLELADKQELRFSFRVDSPARQVRRDWRWEIAEKRVFLNDEEVELNDKRFVNDRYWLLFPLEALHSADHATLSIESDTTVAPFTKLPATLVLVHYSGDEGYTPGDAYELYIDADLNVIEWGFRRGNATPAGLRNRWANYKTFDGISLSLDRPGNRDAKISFSDVSIK